MPRMSIPACASQHHQKHGRTESLPWDEQGRYRDRRAKLSTMFRIVHRFPTVKFLVNLAVFDDPPQPVSGVATSA